MDSVYDTFDFLMQEPVLASVEALKEHNKKKLDAAIKDMDKVSKKHAAKKKRYATVAVKYAAMVNLCDFFLQNKASHDMHIAILTLENLQIKEAELIEKQEFEAAALIRDEQELIRKYLSKRTTNGNQRTESSAVNLL